MARFRVKVNERIKGREPQTGLAIDAERSDECDALDGTPTDLRRLKEGYDEHIRD